MKTAKRWIVSAGACLLALTSMNVSFGQIPPAPIPEQNNDGLPLLTEPVPLESAPVGPLQVPDEPADITAPEVNVIQQAAPQAPVNKAEPVAQPAPAPNAKPSTPTQPQGPCQQCCDPCQRCPAGAYYSPSPYYGQDTRPWWLLRPVPYTPVECNDGFGGGHFGGFGGHGGFGGPGRFVRDPYGRLVPIDGPFYSTRGPRDFYLDNPRPLGY